jgi:hypothetical protein
MIKNVKIKIKRYLYIKYCNIMNYDKIINEEIDRFINETFFTEKKKKKSKDEPRDVGKKAKKLTNGRRGEYDFKKERETNPNLNNQDAEDLSTLIDSDYINTAAVAHQWRPDLTPEGAQSELRKKVKGLTNDNGSKYRLKKKDAFKLRRILSKELNK